MDEALDNKPLLRALLGGAIDYAGLYPPAELGMAAAVTNFRSYQSSADAWALGRFVVSAVRLTELEPLLGTGKSLPLSVLIGDVGDVTVIEGFRHRNDVSAARIECVEIKAAPAASAEALFAAVPSEWVRYLEVPLGAGKEILLDTLVARRGFAKMRTGGTSSEAFPPAEDLARFLLATARRQLGFKATAGLHHPLRGSYRLTYADGAPSATMYGYLNLLLAAALAWSNGSESQVREALLEGTPEAIQLDPGGLSWRTTRLSATQLGEMRQRFCHSFGSCSFREPLDELQGGGWW
jgi:hypothetical protein